MTHLCVPIFVTDPARAQRDLALAAEAGAEMVELRIDHLTDDSVVAQAIKATSLPCIVTCRPVWEGGHSELPDDQRLFLLSMAADNGAAYADVELKAFQSGKVGEMLSLSLDQFPRDQRPGLIFSSHDFAGRPDRLYSMIADLTDSPADVVKIVWLARSIRDNLEAFEILKTRQRPTIALCMGEAGLISRVLAKKFGAFLTFASLDPSSGTASGQVPVADMKNLYRWDAINPHTRVYGVVGSPIMHSMSPAIHNAAFESVGYDGVYLPLLVNPGYESFKAFMEEFLNFDGLDLFGLSVTIPHKENCLRYLKEKNAQVEPLAGSIGAVNTVIVDRSGPVPALRGINTDYAAILDSITDKLSIRREDLAGRTAVILGAGGTGRTAGAALAHYGANVIVLNRTLDRAQALASEFDGRTGPVRAAALDSLADHPADIYLNTTSVGMHPHSDQTPIPEPILRRLPAHALVFDAIYNPMKTRLLAEAESAGLQTVGGVEMFLRQAIAQFQAWTALPAPADLMRQVITGRLAPQPLE